MRFLLLALLVACATPSTSAQVSLGFRAGVNVASISNALGQTPPAGYNQQPRLGGAGGVWLRYDVAPSLGVQAEALYSQKGTRVVVTGGNGESGEIRLELDYVEVPVLLRVSPITGPGLDLGLFAGGAYAFKMREALTIVSDGESTTRTGSDAYSSSDLGIVGGLDLSAGNIGVDLRYTYGLTDIVPEAFVKGGDDGMTPASTNGVFTAGLTFKIGQ